eukprot:TRINITY_DN495_c0_g1_i1.p1 TRINITY_DN495_c0_g1~~TRINITY_DN495_c0_g1_i1.p1  ORF type:complete len:538 (-),score=32.64 TRINITY_DN495_c0_g1_i1:141-1754(-)
MEYAARAFGFGTPVTDPNVSISRDGFCSRIGGAICGACIGVVLLIVFCVILVWNEGKTVKDQKAIQQGRKDVVELGCSMDTAKVGKLVHASCSLSSTRLSDPVFSSVAVNGVWLSRSVEMLQWTESSTSSKSNGQTVTRYSYSTTWSSGQISTSSFHNPQGCGGTCYNPTFPSFSSQKWWVEPTFFGNFTLPTDLRNKITGSTAITPPSTSRSCSQLSSSQPPSVISTDTTTPSGGYLYTNCGNVVGTLRIKWTASSATSASVLAKLTDAGSFVEWKASSGSTIYRLSEGNKSASSMFDDASSAAKVRTWVLRFVGWLLIWLGLQLITGPVAVMPTIIPCVGDFLSDIVGCVLCAVNCCLATGIALFFIALGWLAYRPAVGVPLLIAGFVGCILCCVAAYMKKKKGGKVSAQAGPQVVVAQPAQPMPNPQYPQQLPPGYDPNAQQGYTGQPQGYQQPPPGYPATQQPPAGYAGPLPPPGYAGGPPPGYAPPPQAYPPGYGGAPPGYPPQGQLPPGYAPPPPGYQQPPPGYQPGKAWG